MQKTGNKLLNFKNIKPIKHLGQNFLIDKNVLAQIIEAADLLPNDIVLEIGPGTGILTLELAKRVKQVIAVEKDKRMCEVLQKILNAEKIKNVEIINQDVLKLNRQKIHDREFSVTYKIVANIPYYLTSPLIRKFLEAPHPPSLMILMVQKEVAQRICAKPPKMSLLAVAVQFYANAKIINYVSKNSFYPVPKVDSAILQIEPQINTNLRPNEYESFFKLVKRGFAAKRKVLINNLSRELKIENCKLKILFDQIGFNQKSRAENLSVDNWIELYTILTNKNLL